MNTYSLLSTNMFENGWEGHNHSTGDFDINLKHVIWPKKKGCFCEAYTGYFVELLKADVSSL